MEYRIEREGKIECCRRPVRGVCMKGGFESGYRSGWHRAYSLNPEFSRPLIWGAS
jgi:hypothetical protein